MRIFRKSISRKDLLMIEGFGGILYITGSDIKNVVL